MNVTLVPETNLTVTDSLLFLGFGGVEPWGGFTVNQELNYGVVAYDNGLKALNWLKQQSTETLPYAVICDFDLLKREDFSFLKGLKEDQNLANIPVIALKDEETAIDFSEVIRLGLDDCYDIDTDWNIIWDRLEFLHEFKPKMAGFRELEKDSFQYRIPFAKRMLDIIIASCAILALSPIFIFVAIAIKLESRGPIIYRSKRVGRGYQIFGFLKFRSMYKDADQRLKDLQHLNQYKGNDNAFVKIQNDPRITKIGQVIRKTSIDELPQLFNVLKGEMSIVGNRPLPLYEAELLTRDDWAKRFLAPAGITGLWQVTKRGKDDMSTQERMDLDITYANNYSFWYDMKIIAKTFPAMIQQENV